MLSLVSTTPPINCSLVSTTPPITCSPVSTTPPINFSPIINCIDDRGLFFLKIRTNRWYLRLPKADTAADGVIGKVAFIGTLHILIRGPWGRQNYFKPKRWYLVLAASGASDQDVWMQLFMAVPMTPSAVVSDFGGRRYHQFVPFNFLLSLATPHPHGVLILVTGNKFIAGVVVTGDNCSPVSLSPVIIVHRCRWHRWEKFITGINDTGDHWKSVTRIIAGVVDTGEQLIAGVVDTGDKHSFANISVNFWKNLKGP